MGIYGHTNIIHSPEQRQKLEGGIRSVGYGNIVVWAIETNCKTLLRKDSDDKPKCHSSL